MTEKEGQINVTMIKCPSCKRRFAVADDYDGVITCCYCSSYVEG